MPQESAHIYLFEFQVERRELETRPTPFCPTLPATRIKRNLQFQRSKSWRASQRLGTIMHFQELSKSNPDYEEPMRRVYERVPHARSIHLLSRAPLAVRRSQSHLSSSGTMKHAPSRKDRPYKTVPKRFFGVIQITFSYQSPISSYQKKNSCHYYGPQPCCGI